MLFSFDGNTNFKTIRSDVFVRGAYSRASQGLTPVTTSAAGYSQLLTHHPLFF